MGHTPVHYLPLVTTLLSAIFFPVLLRAAYVRKSGPHLAWWAVGVLCYGLGTCVESWITLAGNSIELTKAWYITGALLGGYPLAQGSVYLLAKRRTANILSAVSIPFVVLAIALVIISPVHPELLDPLRPSGKILAWSWIRLMTPFINLYAFVFLVGGAVISAKRYAKIAMERYRAVGNGWIAVGALLPGIGGSLAKAGMVEALYVLELVGLLFMWIGYMIIVAKRHQAAPSMAS